MSYESYTVTEIQSLTPDIGHCLDALLVLGGKDDANGIRKLLDTAGMKSSSGTKFTATKVRSNLQLLKIPSLGKDNYILSSHWLHHLLVARGTSANQGLQQLAATQLITSAGSRRFYNYGFADNSVENCKLAFLANDAEQFSKAYADLTNKSSPASYYRRPDPAPLYELLRAAKSDFLLWRNPTILAQWAALVVTEDQKIEGATAELLLNVYAQQDFLETEAYRSPEYGGILLIHEVMQRPLIRKKHFDLDLLSAMLSGQTTTSELLLERLDEIKQRADLLDAMMLIHAIQRQLIDGDRAIKVLAKVKISRDRFALSFFDILLKERAGSSGDSADRMMKLLPSSPSFNALDWVMMGWVANWLGWRPPPSTLDILLQRLDDGDYDAYPWVRGEINNALARLLPVHSLAGAWKEEASRIAAEYKFDYFLTQLNVRPTWKTAFETLKKLTRPATAATDASPADLPAQRTVWILDFARQTALVREQTLGKSGYSSGRKLSWQDLFAGYRRAYREPQDFDTEMAITRYDGRPFRMDSYFRDDDIRYDFAGILYALVGHPRVYIDDRRRIPIELKRESPSLSVTEKEGSLEVRFDPPLNTLGKYQYKRITPTRYYVYKLDDRQLELAKALNYGIDLPASERPELEEQLNGLRNEITIHSDTDLLESDLPKVEGSDRISVHLLPVGEGYRIQFLARPLPDLPLYFSPGDGLARSLAAAEEGKQILIRDLAGEERAAERILSSCPTLAALPQVQYEWTVSKQLEALRVLLELRTLLREGTIEIEYPRGEKLRLSGATDFEDLSLKVGKQRDWFEVSGKLKIDEDQVLDLQFLLEQLRENDTGFIQIRENEFVALTDQLRERIQEMEGLLHQKGKSLQLPNLAASQFAELTEGLEEVEFDAEWQAALQRIETARHLRPRPPQPFTADLRDYQKVGYEWLMRLATWGVGACLADDMGLGKTVQALAMLTSRAESGPGLVLAPASVTRNWRAECERFAPALTPKLLARTSEVGVLDELGAGDLLIVSYGLLPFIGEELAAVRYGTIILDEAQAIKNATTKRARLVSQLEADFRVATTGTPIENNLGELWSLFRFLNPGLLGGRTAFNQKFALPIAREEHGKRDQLKRLVQPFILRRRKDEVLKELPAKTEIVLNVSAGEREAALYEAIRREALKKIAEAPPEQKRFVVLTQLTKLRQAACHPRLVRPTSKIPSAKLELVSETIQELLDNGHKALVFSQFVKHLKLVEAWVKKAGIPYQYLDGSTPGGKRAASVKAFQDGEGQLFLISLKAGGTGLNLTEADYVLHLDPWWNPAAEDQASDRAHRIGQQRPVTVYRFVTEGTIEEKVIALHAEKRDLADQILAGSGRSAKLEVDEILEMIRD